MVSVDFTVKELVKEDLTRFKDSFFESLSRVREVGKVDLNAAYIILENINSQDSHIFVAVTDSEIIGTTTVLIEQKFIRQGARVAHIEDVSTKKEYEGHGIARAVINHAIDYARERKCYKVILDCSEETIGFYEKLGFKRNENHMRFDLI